MSTRYNEPDDGIALISKAALRSARRLRQRKVRRDSGFFLAEGAQAVREALGRPDVVAQLIVDNPDDHIELINAADPQVEIVRAHRDEIRSLTDTVTPQGIVAVCQWPFVELDEITRPQLVVICSQVRDPGNAGNVVRCADAFGADAVILTRDSVDITNPKTVRSSVGSIFHLPIITDVELPEAIEWAHAQGMQVLAADGGGASLNELADEGVLARPTAWVMGNEAWGFPADQLALTDQVAAVPMWGHAESLNLSNAASICLYATASEQRRQMSP